MIEQEDVTYGREFGDGVLLGDDPEYFFKLNRDQQVQALAWSHGCPVKNHVVEKYGLEFARKRYAECNFVFGLIACRSGHLNLSLHKEITKTTVRPDYEPVGKHEPESVPVAYFGYVSPMSSHTGYAAPRVLIEQFGIDDARTPDRVLRGLDILDEAIKESKTPESFLVNLSERVASEDGVDPKDVLGQLLSDGFLGEGSFYTSFSTVLGLMKKEAPVLWETYSDLSPSDRFFGGIAYIRTT